MKGFVLAAVLHSLRQALAIVLAGLAVAGTAYLGSHKLSNPDHYRYGGCYRTFFTHGFPPRCNPPTRAAWQIPLAIAIGVVGLGSALAVAGKRPLQRARSGRRVYRSECV